MGALECTVPRRSYDPSKITVALPLKAEHVSETEDFESRRNIVKFTIVKKTEPDHAEQAELASFEDAMLPHLDAAHNLAKWLLRNEEDAKDVVQEAYLRAFKSFGGFHGSNGRAWLLTIVRNTSYTLLKKNRAADLTTTFDEEIHAASDESASPAIIVEHAEDAELVTKAMDELPAEFREILVSAPSGKSLLQGNRRHRSNSARHSHVTARPRAWKLKEYLAAQIGKE